MSIFREYDIRGVFGDDLNRDVVFKVGYLLADIIKSNGEGAVAIGYDARVHSPDVFVWLANGFMSNGVSVYCLGMVPTPVGYFVVFDDSRVRSSVVITGSHNPPDYNGMKITVSKEPFYGDRLKSLGCDALNLGNVKYRHFDVSFNRIDALGSYIDFLVDHFECLRGFRHRVAFDCGNGVAGLAIRPVLERLGIDFRLMYSDPDGTFPNHHPDPSKKANLSSLRDVLIKDGISIGIAYDGDADRVVLLSGSYVFGGDELAILFARDLAKKVPNLTVIGEVKCSQLMYDEINKLGTSVMCKTGHSNIKVKLNELDAHLACEVSGHIFFRDRYFGYDDGIYASLRILELIKSLDANGDGIGNLEKQILTLPTVFKTDEENISASDAKKFQVIESLKEALKEPPPGFPPIKDVIDLDGVRIVFEDGWALVRASNTTPVLVTRFEASSRPVLDLYRQSVLSLVNEILG